MEELCLQLGLIYWVKRIHDIYLENDGTTNMCTVPIIVSLFFTHDVEDDNLIWMFIYRE
jgi:hypothetical protein